MVVYYETYFFCYRKRIQILKYDNWLLYFGTFRNYDTRGDKYIEFWKNNREKNT